MGSTDRLPYIYIRRVRHKGKESPGWWCSGVCSPGGWKTVVIVLLEVYVCVGYSGAPVVCV